MTTDDQGTRNFSPKIENWPFWLGVVLIATGSYFAFAVDNPSLLTKLVIAGITEFGFAFFIAHIIIITVDKREKENFFEIIRQNRDKFEKEQKAAERRLSGKIYLSHVLDIDLPRSISDELAEYISSNKLIKTEQKINYTIDPVGNYIRLIQVLDATFVNAHREAVDFQPTFKSHYNKLPDVEAALKDEKFGILKFYAALQDGQECLDFNTNEDGVEFKEPIVLEHGDKIRIRIVYATPKHQSDNEIFTNSAFSEKLEINARYDSSKYTIGFRCLHPRTDCMTVVKGDGEDNVTFCYPFLPSNGVVLWWRLKSNSPNAA